MTEVWLIFAIFSVLIGLTIGSFLNVCIARMPEHRSLLRPSHCPRCDNPIRPADNVPVVSWVMLRAKCRNCASPIPVTYPLIEVLGGLMAWLCWMRFVPSPEVLDVQHVTAWVVFFGFVCALLVAAFSDLRTFVVPEQVSSWAVPVGLVAHIILSWLGYDGWLAIGWRHAFLGAGVAGSLFAFLSWTAERLLGADALGWGDVRLMAMIGGFVGALPGAFMVMLWGSMLGAIIGLAALIIMRRRGVLPFAPSLAFGGILYVLYGDILTKAYFPQFAALGYLMR